MKFIYKFAKCIFSDKNERNVRCIYLMCIIAIYYNRDPIRVHFNIACAN